MLSKYHFILPGCAAVISLVLADVHAADRGAVQLVLPNAVSVDHELVRVGHVCQVVGGPLALRQRISRLDIEQRRADSKPVSITADQIVARLLLDGIPRGQFAIGGADSVRAQWSATQSQTLAQVQGTQSINDGGVLAVLREPIARQLGVDAEDLFLRMSRPLPATVRNLQVLGEVELRPLLRNTVRPGSNSMKLGIYQQEQLLTTFSVGVDVGLMRSVYVASKRLDSGELLTTENVRLQRRTVLGRAATDYATEVIEQRLKRSVRPGQILLQSDLRRQANSAKEIVVRRRDLVQLTARKGKLAVSISGAQALQQGSVGDVIRVRNPESGKIITAQVVGQGTVEVRL